MFLDLKKHSIPPSIISAGLLSLFLAGPCGAQTIVNGGLHSELIVSDEAISHSGPLVVPSAPWSNIIADAAQKSDLPFEFLSRLLRQESGFFPLAVSHSGAQGIAQFMPGTASERGLDDPFDPRHAIPAAASYLHELRMQFGNLGLAAAAYNAGPRAVSAWLAGNGALPQETVAYVRKITGRSVKSWAPNRVVRFGILSNAGPIGSSVASDRFSVGRGNRNKVPKSQHSLTAEARLCEEFKKTGKSCVVQALY